MRAMPVPQSSNQQSPNSSCIECEDQPASITCRGCEGEIYCSVCHGSLYRKTSRRRHETKAFGTASLDIAMTEAPLVQDEKRVKRAIPYLWLFLLHKAILVIITQSIFRWIVSNCEFDHSCVICGSSFHGWSACSKRQLCKDFAIGKCTRATC